MTDETTNKKNIISELQQRTKRLELIAQIGQRTTSILELNELFSQTVHLIHETFKYHSVCIFFVQGKNILLKAATLPSLHSLEGKLNITIGKEGITGWVAAKGAPLIVPDVSKETRYYYVEIEEMETKSEIAVPIKLKGEILGVLDAQSTKKNDFTQIDVYTLQTIADQLAISIENAQLYANAQRQIKKQSRAEKLIKESERRFRTLYENMAIGIYRTTPEGKVIAANPALCRMLGYKSYEKLSKRNLEKEGFEAGYNREYFKKLIERDGQIRGLESAWLKKDGTTLFIRESASPVYDEKGKIRYYDGSIEDMTESKLLEKRIQQTQKMEAIGQLTGGMAHDFNNILTVINGSAELALKKIKKEDSLYKHLWDILQSGKMATNLIQKLLAFSRRQLIKPLPLNINQVIQNLDKMMRRLISEDIQINKILTSDIPLIKADLGQVEQIFMNLIINSRDAIHAHDDPSAKKIITIETRSVEIDQSYQLSHPGSSTGPHVLISISDTGVGMNEHIRNRVFEPFFTTKAKDKGTGLGLSTVFGIVKQNNGSIYTYSEPGKGTTFDIFWPTVTGKEHLVRDNNHQRIKDLTGHESLLVIEDNQYVREFTCTALRSLGYRVIEAQDGNKALKMVQGKKMRFDLLISDLVMPGMGGIEVAQKIKEIVPTIKVLLTSGYAEDHVIFNNDEIELDFNFIHKPYSQAMLGKKIRVILDSD